CQEVKNGALVLLDASSPSVGPLLRSFARANGLVVITLIDEALLLPVDTADERFIQIEPPGTAMLRIVADIVRFDNLTNVAILYDDSFNLHEVPRWLISGVLSHHLYQAIDRSTLARVLNDIKELEIENVFIVAASTNVDYVLGQANAPLHDAAINWFVVTKDAKMSCDGCVHNTRVVVAEADGSNEKRQVYVQFVQKEINSFFQSPDLKVDEVFAYDLMQIFDGRIPEANFTKITSCYGDNVISNETLLTSDTIIKNFKDVNHEGVYGPIVSVEGGLRQQVRMNIREVHYSKGTVSASSMLGVWTEKTGLNVTVSSLTAAKSQKSYKVVVIPSVRVHYTIKHYELYESEDGYFGALNEDGTWNGAIKELIEKHADIAIGPLSVMSERENVVDFTVPYHEPVGLTILMKKQKFEYILHKFLKVLELNVWLVIVASFFLFSILMWLFDKFSPFSYQNNPDSSTGPEKRIFTFKEGIWFCMTSLTPQGGGEAPRAISGRLVAATWWLYGFLLIAFYTANLAATLTVTRLETPIESLDDLSKQQSVKYGPVNGTAALVYFTRMKQIEEDFYRIWKDMSLNDSLSPVARAKLAVWDYPVSEQFTKLMGRMHVPDTAQEALRMVKDGEFAFIDDASRNQYQVLTDCDVEVIGEEFSRKPFAFAVTQGSPLRAQISNVILELSNNRILEDLTNKWWDSNELHKDCPRIENESDGISIKNIGGVFLLIAIGTGLSLIAFVCEYYYYRVRPKKQERLYAMEGNTRLSRIETEISLDDISVQQQPSDRTPGKALADPPRKNPLENGRTHHELSPVTNGDKTANNGSYRRKSTSRGHSTSKAEHRNGSVSNGISNSAFIYDTPKSMAKKYTDLNKDSISERFPTMYKESMSERFPNLNKNGDVQAAFSEKL
ncbi:IR25A-like protein, partial [Mya arenaria]